MQLLYIFIGIVGLAMVIISIRLLSKINGASPIMQMGLIQESKEVNFEKPGLYSVCLTNGYAKNVGSFGISITLNGERVPVYERIISPAYFYNGGIISEYGYFEINNPGV